MYTIFNGHAMSIGRGQDFDDTKNNATAKKATEIIFCSCNFLTSMFQCY